MDTGRLQMGRRRCVPFNTKRRPRRPPFARQLSEHHAELTIGTIKDWQQQQQSGSSPAHAGSHRLSAHKST